MCLRLSHLFRLYPLYLLLAAALLGVDVVASPLPRTDAATAQRQFILLRIGNYDWEQRQWKQNRDTTMQWPKVLCIGDSRCFGYTPANIIEEIPPKTIQRLQGTKVKHALYRTMKARVDLSTFDRARQSLFDSLSSVATLQTAIKGRINIENDESCIRAILNLMVEKGIVTDYDDQKSLEDNMKPVCIQTISKLRFGFYDWSKNSWVGKKGGIKPNFLCLPCSRMCLGFDEQNSRVEAMPPQYHLISTDKRNIDPYRNPTLVYTFDHKKRGDWSDPDQKHRSLVQFLQDIGDLKKAAGGEITDPESYIRAILRYLSLDSFPNARMMWMVKMSEMEKSNTKRVGMVKMLEIVWIALKSTILALFKRPGASRMEMVRRSEEVKRSEMVEMIAQPTMLALKSTILALSSRIPPARVLLSTI
ncbi:hypothetical protein GGU11DRAFT_782640 [Lentinula aff. detonsa]|nr:hypothetical protein GGU11DRAFT_782640 [Lentinula aff. detonsa]